MRLISFMRLGRAGFGVVDGGGVIEATGFGGAATLREALVADLLPALADWAAGRRPQLSLTEVTFLPVIPDPGKILGIGLNYLRHKQETMRPDVDHPTVFTRYADSQVGHLQPLVRPAVSQRLDYEGELALVIGRGGRNIPEGRALDHVAGFACYNDGSVRDWQRHTFQFTPGKTFPATGGFGPWLVTPDEIGDYRTLPIRTLLNGRVMQEATLAELLFPLERLIAYCSTFTPLAPGDVIMTGTPGGVGDKREPPVYLAPGDVVEVDIGPVGRLVNPVIAEEGIAVPAGS